MQDKIIQLSEQGYSVRVGDYFGEAWALIKPHLGIFIGFSLLSFVIAMMVSIVPFAGIVVNPLISAAFYLALRAADKGENVSLDTFFSVLKTEHIGNLILTALVSALLIIIGMLFIILPGIYLAVGYSFIVPLVLFSGEKDFWQILENSRKIITANWWGIFGWIIVVGIVVTFATIFTLFIGLVVIYPWFYAISYVGYKDIVGFDEEEKELSDHLVSDL